MAGFSLSGAFMPQPIETVEEFEQLNDHLDLSDHEPVIVDTDNEDELEAFDQSH